jgi:putative transposase
VTDALRTQVREGLKTMADARLTRVLEALGVARSSWDYTPPPAQERQLPGPRPRPVAETTESLALAITEAKPTWGYKKVAVLCRCADARITDRQVYKVFKKHGLLHARRPRKAELHQASKLYELLPQRPDDLWQMDVTYIHIPGHGWWYAITVIDYFSRYLLALHFTASYSALEATTALARARQEAETLHGPLTRTPFIVTDNGSSFIAHRFQQFVADEYRHVRIQYRTPTQLGLLERFHATLKQEEVYWQLYDSPAQARESLADFRESYNMVRPHWALIPVGGGDPLTPYNVYVEEMAVKLPKWQGWAKGAKEKLEKLLNQESGEAA